MPRSMLVACVILAGGAACAGAPVCPAPAPAPVVVAIPDGGGAPCYPEHRVLFAENVRAEVDTIAPYNGERAGTPTMYGTCRVAEGVITDARGNELARIHCGIDVVARGLADNLLNEVGASGQRVIDGHPDAARDLACVELGDRVRCSFLAPDDSDAEPRAYYYVAGPLGTDVLRGAPALAFFAGRTVTAFQMRGYCH